MRVLKTLLCMILAMLFAMNIGYAATLEKETIVLMDSISKKTVSYKICNTLLNGKELDTDVPGYIVESGGKQTVYVPVSTIYRSLNASVAWSEKNKKLTIVQGKSTYIFEIDKTFVVKDGKNISIDDKMPIKLMKYAGTDRTMLPVSFIAKSMGMEMSYQPEVRTVNISQPLAKVNGFSYNGTKPFKEIRIATTTEISTTSYMIDGSEFGGKSKVIVEFQNALLAPNVMTGLEVKDGTVSRIDLIDPKKTPPRVRLEIEMEKTTGFYSYYDKASKEQVIQLVNVLKDAVVGKEGDYHTVSFKTGVAPEIAVKKLQGKLVIDFLNTKLSYNNGSAGEKEVLSAGINNVAFSQFDSSKEYREGEMVSRMVVNFMDPSQQERAYIKKTKDGLVVYVEGDPDRGVGYSKTGNATSTIQLGVKNPDKVTKTLNSETGELTLMIPKESTTLENVFREYDDNILKYLDVNSNIDEKNYRVVIKFENGTVVYDNSHDEVMSLAFINEKIQKSSNGKKLIVLDAGHGGSDPGTLGKFTGVKEKDLALTAVNALKDELERNGFEVLLTRSNDSRVELLQRTDLANEVGADLFVSIHYNAADAQNANGIEVLYYPDEAGVKFEFANTLYTELIKETGATPRGVIKRPLLVVPRETKMPSALIEMGFVSNRDEEIKVQNEAYLSVQVKAITQAILIYLSNH